MSGRIQKDAIYSSSELPQLPQWRAADKCRNKYTYPNGLLTLKCNKDKIAYSIARYKNKAKDESWIFRRSISSDENFQGHVLEFLIAESGCWKSLENDELPDDVITVYHEVTQESNVWIGKHIDFGIGLVKLSDDKFTYFYKEHQCKDSLKFTVLCTNK